jgi:hypothetical protein
MSYCLPLCEDLSRHLILTFILTTAPTMQLKDDRRDTSPLNIKFDALVEGLLEKWHVPGISIAVVDGDKTYSKVSNFIFDIHGY